MVTCQRVSSAFFRPCIWSVTTFLPLLLCLSFHRERLLSLGAYPVLLPCACVVDSQAAIGRHRNGAKCVEALGFRHAANGTAHGVYTCPVITQSEEDSDRLVALVLVREALSTALQGGSAATQTAAAPAPAPAAAPAPASVAAPAVAASVPAATATAALVPPPAASTSTSSAKPEEEMTEEELIELALRMSMEEQGDGK